MQIWFMIAKVLVKEIHRLVNLGDMENAFMVAVEVDVVQREMARIGMTMHVANTQAKALDELKTAALRPATQDSQPTVGLNLENFLFPQHMS